MTTITIPASELQPGDQISFGGQTVTVLEITRHLRMPDIVTLSATGLWTRCPDSRDLLTVSKALMLTVERPEPVGPEADLIEAMAKAIYDTYLADETLDDGEWVTVSKGPIGSRLRKEARAALAVVRAAK